MSLQFMKTLHRIQLIMSYIMDNPIFAKMRVLLPYRENSEHTLNLSDREYIHSRFFNIAVGTNFIFHHYFRP